jgi:cytoskeletal protein CcmA (bactofilin family)
MISNYFEQDDADSSALKYSRRGGSSNTSAACVTWSVLVAAVAVTAFVLGLISLLKTTATATAPGSWVPPGSADPSPQSGLPGQFYFNIETGAVWYKLPAASASGAAVSTRGGTVIVQSSWIQVNNAVSVSGDVTGTSDNVTVTKVGGLSASFIAEAVLASQNMSFPTIGPVLHANGVVFPATADADSRLTWTSDRTLEFESLSSAPVIVNIKGHLHVNGAPVGDIVSTGTITTDSVPVFADWTGKIIASSGITVDSNNNINNVNTLNAQSVLINGVPIGSGGNGNANNNGTITGPESSGVNELAVFASSTGDTLASRTGVTLSVGRILSGLSALTVDGKATCGFMKITHNVSVAGYMHSNDAHITNTLHSAGLHVDQNVTIGDTVTTHYLQAIQKVTSHELSVDSAHVNGLLTTTSLLVENNAVIETVTADTVSVQSLNAANTLTSHNMSSTGNADFQGPVTAVSITAGSLSLSGTAVVNGALSTSSSLAVASSATIGSVLSAAAIATPSLNVTGNARVSGGVSIAGNVTSGPVSTSSINVTGNANVAGSIAISNGCTTNALTVTGTAVTGSLSVTGNSVFGSLTSASITTSALTTTGATAISSLAVTGNALVSGTLTSTGAISTSTLTVTGNTSTGPLTVNGTLTVPGNATLGPLRVTGNAVVVNGSVTSTGATSTSSLLVSGNATVAGHLINNGVTSNTLTVSGNATTGSLSVNGNAAVTGALTTTGAISTSSLFVSGNATVAGLLINSGLTSTTLTVSGNATTSSLSVNGNAVINGSVLSTGATATNMLLVSGNATVAGHLSGSVVNSNTLLVLGNATTGSLSVSGDAVVSGSLSSNGGVTTTTLTASGNAVLTGSLTSNGGVTTTTLTVTGSATTGPLTVTGSLVTNNNGTITTNSLSVASNASVSGSLTVNTLNATSSMRTSVLTVTGNATVTGNVTVSGASRFTTVNAESINANSSIVSPSIGTSGIATPWTYLPGMSGNWQNLQTTSVRWRKIGKQVTIGISHSVVNVASFCLTSPCFTVPMITPAASANWPFADLRPPRDTLCTAIVETGTYTSGVYNNGNLAGLPIKIIAATGNIQFFSLPNGANTYWKLPDEVYCTWLQD